MKIKNLIGMLSLIVLAASSTAFITPTPNVFPTKIETGGESFAEFLSHFKKTDLPFSIGLNDFGRYNEYLKEGKKQSKQNRHRIRNAKFIPQSNAPKFSRMGALKVHSVARFHPNNKMVAVIYSASLGHSMDLNTEYNMLVYDLKGNIIFPKPKKKERISPFFLGHSSGTETQTCTIDAKGNIWKNTYQNIWKNDLKEKGFKDNFLVDFKLSNTEVFHLDEKSGFVQLKEIPTEVKASLH